MRTSYMMKGLFIAMLLLMQGCAFQQDKSDWFGIDKLKHFTVSTVLGAGFTKLAEKQQPDCVAFASGTSISITIGLGKEWYDRDIKKTYWSEKDVFYDVLGSLTGASLATHCF